MVFDAYVVWLGTTPMLRSQPEPCYSLFVLKVVERTREDGPWDISLKILNHGFFVEGLLPKGR